MTSINRSSLTCPTCPTCPTILYRQAGACITHCLWQVYTNSPFVSVKVRKSPFSPNRRRTALTLKGEQHELKLPIFYGGRAKPDRRHVSNSKKRRDPTSTLTNPFSHPASLHYAATSKPPKAVSPRWSDSGTRALTLKGE